MAAQRAVQGVISGCALIFLGACGADGAVTGSSTVGLALEAAAPEGIECIDTWVNGETVGLLYASSIPSDGDKVREVHHIRSTDGGQTWSSPVRVDADVDAVLGSRPWAGPQVAAHGDQIVALWTTTGSGFMGRGPLVTAVSSDGGATWSAGGAPAMPAERSEQAFPDLAVDSKGVFHAIWLERIGGSEKKSLLHGSSADGGMTWTAPIVVDDKACECCWNRLVVGPGDDLFAIYRDLEPRDMSVAKLPAGAPEWESLGNAGAFDWQFDGCPHVGGGLQPIASDAGGALHAVVWTGKESDSGAHYVRSVDGGRSWEEPSPLASSMAVHSDIAGTADGLLLAVWDSREDGLGVVVRSASFDGGETWNDPIRLSRSDESADYPSVMVLPDGFLFFWFVLEGDNRVLRSLRLTSEDVRSA